MQRESPAPVGAHLTGALDALACAVCAHRHRVTVRTDGRETTYDAACSECACAASGELYETGFGDVEAALAPIFAARAAFADIRANFDARPACAIHHLPGPCFLISEPAHISARMGRLRLLLHRLAGVAR